MKYAGRDFGGIFEGYRWRGHKAGELAVDPVRAYDLAHVDGTDVCRTCGFIKASHGSMGKEGDPQYLVCPGDVILTAPDGRTFPVSRVVLEELLVELMLVAGNADGLRDVRV